MVRILEIKNNILNIWQRTAKDFEQRIKLYEAATEIFKVRVLKYQNRHQKYKDVNYLISKMEDFFDKVESYWGKSVDNEEGLSTITFLYSEEFDLREKFLEIFPEIDALVRVKTDQPHYERLLIIKKQIEDYSMYRKIFLSVFSKNNIGMKIKRHTTVRNLWMLLERYHTLLISKEGVDWISNKSDDKSKEDDPDRQEGSAALDGTTPHTSGSAYTCRLGYTRPPCTLRRMSEYRPGTGPSTASMSPSAPVFG